MIELLMSASWRLDAVSPRGQARLRWSVPIFALGAGALESAYLFSVQMVYWAIEPHPPTLMQAAQTYAAIYPQQAFAALPFTLGGALTWWLFVVVGHHVSAGDGAVTAGVSTFVSVLVAYVVLIAHLFTLIAPNYSGDASIALDDVMMAMSYVAVYPVGWGVLLVLAAWGALCGAWLRRSLVKKRDAVVAPASWG